MKPERWKATIVLSADHAGINQELGRVEHALLAGLSRIDDARKVRDFLEHIAAASWQWCEQHHIDMRGWMDNSRYRAR